MESDSGARAISIPTRSVPNDPDLHRPAAVQLRPDRLHSLLLDNWEPASFYDCIADNVSIGLNIKVKEQSLENRARGRKT